MPDLTLPLASGPVPAYLAVPSGAGPWPGVVVVHEAFGLNDDIRAIADRFAAEGYTALAPDLVAGGNRIACLVKVARAMATGEGPAARVIEAARGWLAAREDATGAVGSGAARAACGGSRSALSYWARNLASSGSPRLCASASISRVP